MVHNYGVAYLLFDDIGAAYLPGTSSVLVVYIRNHPGTNCMWLKPGRYSSHTEN